MFEKEAEKYYETETPMIENITGLDFQNEVIKAFQKGAEFGYNKANEWHYVKDGDLPKGEDTEREKVYAIFKNKSYYIVDRAAVKNYEDLIAWTELPTFKRT